MKSYYRLLKESRVIWLIILSTIANIIFYVVDTYTVKEAIDNLSKDKTVIAIAHRLTTLENSDYLVGIENHKIVEQGTKKELSKEGTLYYKLTHQ